MTPLLVSIFKIYMPVDRELISKDFEMDLKILTCLPVTSKIETLETNRSEGISTFKTPLDGFG